MEAESNSNRDDACKYNHIGVNYNLFLLYRPMYLLKLNFNSNADIVFHYCYGSLFVLTEDFDCASQRILSSS